VATGAGGGTGWSAAVAVVPVPAAETAGAVAAALVAASHLSNLAGLLSKPHARTFRWREAARGDGARALWTS